MIIIFYIYDINSDNRELKNIDVENGLSCYSNNTEEHNKIPNKITPVTYSSSLPKTTPHIFLSHASTSIPPLISISSTLLNPLHHPCKSRKCRVSSIKKRLVNIYKTSIVDTLRCLRLKKKKKMFRKMSTVSSVTSYYQLV